MNQEFLQYYARELEQLRKQELQHVRDVAGEFAGRHRDRADELGLTATDCQDPFVERLLEGFAFLAARVQYKFDAEFPRLTHALFEAVFPGYLAPVPSMTVVQYTPDPGETALAGGPVIGRHEHIQCRAVVGGQSRRCTYRTAHPVALWPLEVAEAAYVTKELPRHDLPAGLPGPVAAALHIRLATTTSSIPLSALRGLDSLNFFIRGAAPTPARVYENLFASRAGPGGGRRLVGVLARPADGPPDVRAAASAVLPPTAVTRVGFAADEALLPDSPRSFEGYRLLQEYFALPQRFLFFRIANLNRVVRQAAGRAVDLLLLLAEPDDRLTRQVDKNTFALFCTPAANLFAPAAPDRIPVSPAAADVHVLPERVATLDREVYSVSKVVGYLDRVAHPDSPPRQEFLPFYAARDRGPAGQYFTTRREARPVPDAARRVGQRIEYPGTEVYLTLVDATCAPYRASLKEVVVEALCTNRDLPLFVVGGGGGGGGRDVGQEAGGVEFTLERNLPVKAVRTVALLTRPQPSRASGPFAWRLISHLSVNYLSLVNAGADGATALRDLLRLYADAADARTRGHVDGLRTVAAGPTYKRLDAVDSRAPVTFARGVEVVLGMDDAALDDGAFVLASVLDQFFARYVSINSFTQTVVRRSSREEVVRWPAKIGQRLVL